MNAEALEAAAVEEEAGTRSVSVNPTILAKSIANWPSTRGSTSALRMRCISRLRSVSFCLDLIARKFHMVFGEISSLADFKPERLLFCSNI